MKKKLLLILIPFALNAQFDKTQHFYAGFGIQQLVTSLLHAKTQRTWLSIGAGALAGAGAGIAKEYINDRAWHRGTFDVNDMYMTFWGTAVGCAVSRVTIDLIERHKDKRQLKLEEMKRNFTFVN
jgi:VanZ family protein